MTTRVKGLLVYLEKDFREDDVCDLVRAIGLIRGVANVSDIPVNIDDALNRQRIRHELEKELLKVVSFT